jgi:hypothetical protein
MGPLSAVAIALGLALTGAYTATWITMSKALFGILLVIFAIVVLIDTFWINTGARWDAHRTARAGTARGPVQ